jgi:hypothetical protein
MCPEGLRHKSMPTKSVYIRVKRALVLLMLGFSLAVFSPAVAYAASDHCGDADNGGPVKVSINLGCQGKGNPIMDMLFAAIRFLSLGVGLVIVGSLTYAGIQYTGSRGEPAAHAQAVKRIQANVYALLLFIFAYAIVNYLVPGALLQ